MFRRMLAVFHPNEDFCEVDVQIFFRLNAFVICALTHYTNLVSVLSFWVTVFNDVAKIVVELFSSVCTGDKQSL